MLSVSEFLNSFNNNQLVIKISVQIDHFIESDYPSGSHIHFDDDSVKLTDCKASQPIKYHNLTTHLEVIYILMTIALN